MKDPYFREFTLLPYRFIVANRKTLTPLVWEYKDTEKSGTLYYGKNKQIELRDPFIIGEELDGYLKSESKVPNNIKVDDVNNIEYWLNKL